MPHTLPTALVVLSFSAGALCLSTEPVHADPPLKVNLKSGPEGGAKGTAGNTSEGTSPKVKAEDAQAAAPQKDDAASPKSNLLTSESLGAFAWGADTRALYKAISTLRRSAGSSKKVRRLIKGGQMVFLPSDDIPWQGRTWRGHLHLDGEGLFKVILRAEIETGGADAFVARWLPGVGEPETDADGRRIWKGSASAVVLEIQSVGMSEEAVLTLTRASRFEGSSLSLGID
ncbi:MAG: hypothetical protein ACE366_10315 [Bradymonadia bacterium]